MEKKATKMQSSNVPGVGKTCSAGGSVRERATKKMISYFVWPVGFSIGCFIAYYVCYEIGLEFQMGLGLQFLLCSVLVHLFERWMPFEPKWLQSDNEETCDCSYVLSAAIFEQLAGHLIGIIAGPVCHYFWGDRSSRFWHQMPFVGQVISGLVISEFGGYFSHRLFHIKSLPLWRFHAIHHSVSRLSWINSAHNHPIDMFKKAALSILFLHIFGLGFEDIVFWYLACSNIVTLLSHCNIQTTCGVLNFIFNTPEMHRAHHNCRNGVKTSNFGEIFMFLDLALGTFSRPFHRSSPKMIQIASRPHGFINQTMEPFFSASTMVKSSISDGIKGVKSAIPIEGVVEQVVELHDMLPMQLTGLLPGLDPISNPVVKRRPSLSH